MRRLLRPPDRPSGVDPKLYVVRMVAVAIAGGFHAIQVGIFAVVGLPRLALLSVGSVAWFVGLALLIRAGRGRLATFGAWAEIAAHSLLLTVCFGADAGYGMYWIALATGTFLVFPASEPVTRYGLVGAGMVGAAALQVAPPRAALVPLEPAVLAAFHGMNALGTLVALLAITAYFASASAAAEAETERERQRSERLLRNVLPEAIADRLKDDVGAIGDHHDEVTVLFADLAGFTALAAGLRTDQVLEMLNTLFSRFDALAAHHGLEKIKTIGDAYMVVGNAPEPHPDHVGAVARFAVDLREEVRRYAREGGHPIDVRVGIHTGPVVAGVIGTQRFAWDLWGDTVNTASRMESHGAIGKIHVTDQVRSRLGDAFALEDRGIIEVKSKGPMRTWFLEPRDASG